MQQVVSNALRHLEADVVLRLHRAGTQMRGQNEVRALAQRRVVCQWLGLVYVQRRAADLAGLECLKQVRLADDPAAGAVEQSHAGLHLGEGLLVEQAARFVGQRHVNRDEVGGGINIVQAGQFHLQRLGAGRSDVRIERQHAHAERHRAPRHLAADPAHAQYAECLAVKLDALERLAVPLAAGHRAVRLRNVACERHHH